jgi:hypothetical protein
MNALLIAYSLTIENESGAPGTRLWIFQANDDAEALELAKQRLAGYTLKAGERALLRTDDGYVALRGNWHES